MAPSILRAALAAVVLATAACGGGDPPPPPAAPTLAVVAGNDQAGTVGEQLAQPIVVTATRDNQAAANVTVTFAVASGGGSVSSGSVQTGADGRAQVTWVLGQSTGAQSVSATAGSSTVTFSATANAAALAGVRLVAADTTAPLVGGVGLPVTATLRAVDRFGNGVTGASLQVAVVEGNGSVAAATVVTEPGGIAAVTWTLGPARGTNRLRITAPSLPSLQRDVVGRGVQVSVSGVSPALLRPGQVVTVTGEDLIVPGVGTQVLVDSTAATGVSGVATQITFTVPDVACSPARAVPLVVRVGAAQASVTRDYAPGAFSQTAQLPAVGQLALFSGAAAGCLQFAPAADSQAYLVGVLHTGEDPNDIVPVSMLGLTGTLPPAALAALEARAAARATEEDAAAARAALAAPPADEGRDARRWRLHREAEAALRMRERPLVAQLGLAAATRVPQRTALLPLRPGLATGDTVTVRVPNVLGNLCTDFQSIVARVRRVSQRGVFLEDPGNPVQVADSIYAALAEQLDGFIFDTDTSYFGDPGDRDQNGRIGIMVTKELNRRSASILGFVTSGDFLSVSTCGASNVGEMFYGRAPDPNNTIANGPRNYTEQDLAEDYPFLIAHEFTHIIQFARRSAAQVSAPFLQVWELEGQATLAEELNGYRRLGLAQGQDHGVGVSITLAPRDPRGTDWFGNRFSDLANYFGFAGRSTISPFTPLPRTAGVPEQCNWTWTPPRPSMPCSSNRLIYGIPWTLYRWATDRVLRLNGPGADRTLQRDFVVSAQVGLANIAARVNLPVDQMLARWAAALYLDGRPIPGLSPDLQFTSWNMFNVFNDSIFDTQAPSFDPNVATPVARWRLFASTGRLEPRVRAFGAFADQLQVRSASSSYTIIGGQNRPATALRITQPGGAALPAAMRVWVVRVR